MAVLWAAGVSLAPVHPLPRRLEEERGGNPRSLSAKAYGKFLCRFFDLWYDNYHKGDYISVHAFDNYIRMLMGYPPDNCAMAGACTAYALVEADGNVYPCDFYAARCPGWSRSPARWQGGGHDVDSLFSDLATPDRERHKEHGGPE